MGLQDDDLQAEEWNRTIRAVAKLTSLVKQFPWIINLFKKLPLGMLQRLAPDLARILQLHQVSNLWKNGTSTLFTWQLGWHFRSMMAGYALTRHPVLEY